MLFKFYFKERLYCSVYGLNKIYVDFEDGKKMEGMKLDPKEI